VLVHSKLAIMLMKVLSHWHTGRRTRIEHGRSTYGKIRWL